MTIQTTYPDYQAIVNELIKGCTPEIKLSTYNPRISRVERLKYYRTIRFSGARQTGKTKWCLDFLFSNKDNAIVFTNSKKENVENRILCPGFLDYYLNTIRDSDWIEIPFLEKAPKFVIVDNASSYLHFHSKMLYSWIANTADEDPVIILVG